MEVRFLIRSADPTGEVKMEDWEDVAEFSARVDPSGPPLLLVGRGADGEAKSPALSLQEHDWHRVPVYARGRDTAPREVVTAPLEQNLVVVWPEGESEPSTLKQTSQRGLEFQERHDRLRP